MKTIIASLSYFAALMAAVWFGAGCASLGDGKLEPVTKGNAKAALTAASVAAQYADVQPAVFVPRFKGSLTNVVGLSQQFVDDDTGESVFVDETGSPEHTQAQKEAQHAARKAQRAAALAAVEDASKNGKINERLDAIEAWIRSHR